MATITITPGNSFTATETVTSTKLNDLGSPTAALTAASIGTADIADDAITPALIADNAVTTPAILDANVTFAKLTDVIDSDTMTGASATTLATSESIKAYVDSLTTIKAHCVWNSQLTGTNAPISGSGVTSVTRNSAGNWTINLSVTAPLGNFVTLVSSDTQSGGTINTATGAYSTSTTTVAVRKEGSNGVGYDGTNPISFTAIW
jgi:hypothetical protein